MDRGSLLRGESGAMLPRETRELQPVVFDITPLNMAAYLKATNNPGKPEYSYASGAGGQICKKDNQ